MAENKLPDSLVSYGLIIVLIVGAYFLGVYKTRAEMVSQPGRVAEVQGDEVVPGDAPKASVSGLSEEDWKSLLESPAVALGDPKAPVIMVEFTDYQCPFCKRHFDETFYQIKEEYIDTGKVYYMGRDLPLPFHPNSQPAAVAARCAGKQGKYLQMHDKLFEGQDEWASLSDTTEIFSGYGREIGADVRLCLSDESVIQDVLDDLALAGEIGADGTPTFFINGKLLVGAMPFSSFQSMIEGEL